MLGAKWTFLAACFAFGAPLCGGLLTSFVSTTGPGGLWIALFGVLAVFGYPIVGLVSVVFAAVYAAKKRWRAMLPCAIVPAAVALFLAFPGTFRSIVAAADYIHFAALCSRYEREVEASPRTDEPRLIYFFWVDASLPLDGETLVFLVFDESDEFGLPDIHRSVAWKARALNGYMKSTGFVAGPKMPDEPHHLLGHYYVVRLDW